MTISSIDLILKRIKGATKRSPIAVFNKGIGLDAIFGATIVGQEMIEDGEGLVGVFDNSMDLKEIKVLLENCHE